VGVKRLAPAVGAAVATASWIPLTGAVASFRPPVPRATMTGREHVAARLGLGSLIGFRALYHDLASRHDNFVRRVWVPYRAWNGKRREAVLVLPVWYGPRLDPPIPLVISPHGRGGTARGNARFWGDLAALGPHLAGSGKTLTRGRLSAPDAAATPARVSWPMAVRAITFDFNGTLSQDEPILCEIFRELFAASGRPLSEREYYEELAGLSDETIVTTWLGADGDTASPIVAERVRVYRERVADGSTIREETRAAVRCASASVPVAVVSGAARAEILPVLEAADLAQHFCAVVSSESVARGKPDPEGYLRALAQLAVAASEAVAFGDSEAGVASATGAGVRCIAVGGTHAPERLRAADELVAALDVEVIRRLLASW
jgi:beta-phosphoglucomutase